ncbi:MAG TPA: hypothetical protein VKG20_21535 [Methylomirabilota bacterium]|nr:hypothetical protein [Methylomirabilota bacterium]
MRTAIAVLAVGLAAVGGALLVTGSPPARQAAPTPTPEPVAAAPAGPTPTAAAIDPRRLVVAPDNTEPLHLVGAHVVLLGTPLTVDQQPGVTVIDFLAETRLETGELVTARIPVQLRSPQPVVKFDCVQVWGFYDRPPTLNAYTVAHVNGCQADPRNP